jgi:Peptidase family M28
MIFWKRAFFVVVAGGLLLIPSCSPATKRPDGERWWSHVKILADDKLEGRETGSAGHLKAAEYVASEFAHAGLEPATANGYLQPVPLISMEIDENASTLTLVKETGPDSLILGRDAVFDLHVDPASNIEADLVFAGYGLSIPEAHHDDFAGLDVRGKLVVYLFGAPPALPSSLAAHVQSPAERAMVLNRHGAVGSVCVLRTDVDGYWTRLAAARLRPSMKLAGSSMDESLDLKLAVTVNPEYTDEIFAGSGHSLTEILALEAAGMPLPRFSIPAKLKATASVRRSSLVSQNVIAVWPGTDPRLKNEYLVFSAHLDHLGIGTPIEGDRIFNGAMDNAAGVAALLDVAALLEETGKNLRRSVLFVAVTGEEKGLLGSRFFVNSGAVDPRMIVADINVDMFLPLFPLKKLTIYGLDESNLGDEASAVARLLGDEPQADLEPERNTFVRSDQYSFIRRGIPSLALRFGYDKGSPEESIATRWRAVRYHAPSDDLAQPVDKQAAGAFDALVVKLLERIANREERPRWHELSFFKKFAS